MAIDERIVGREHTPFEHLKDESLEHLITDAARKVLSHAGIEARDIDASWPGNFNSGLVTAASRRRWV